MSEHPHRVQGLAHDEVIADWPPILAPALAGLAQRFHQLADAGPIRWHSPRPFSAAAIVDTGAGPLFVKRHSPRVRSAATLGEEHRFIDHLRQHGLPVAPLLRTDDGCTAVDCDGWTWEVHGIGAGLDLYRDTASWTPVDGGARAEQAGRMLARLHQAAGSYTAAQRGTHMLVARDDLIRADDALAVLQAQLPARPALAAYLARRDWRGDLSAQVIPRQAPVAAALREEPRAWAHNDWHVSNLLWSGLEEDAQVSTVLDFGLASPTSVLFDLATAIERNAIAWLAPGGPRAHVDLALALLRGYRRQRPLRAAQVHLLAALLPVVHFDFALSEVEYFQGPCRNAASADVAYDTFLLGHARWFASTGGQALLEALHAAA